MGGSFAFLVIIYNKRLGYYVHGFQTQLWSV